jgi:hypothetical protein
MQVLHVDCVMCKSPWQRCDYRNTSQMGKAQNAVLGTEIQRTFCQLKAASACQ